MLQLLLMVRVNHESSDESHALTVWKDIFPGYLPLGSKNRQGKANGAVMGLLDIAMQHTPAVIPG